MFKFCSLYSGSSGNSLLVQTENTNILVDAGVSCKKIEQALSDLNVEIESVDGVIVTHEHTDHVQGLGILAKKYNIPVFVNQETLDAMPKQKDKIPDENIKLFKVSEKFEIKDLKINSFKIPHDAANPVGFNIFNKENKKISVATDIGNMNWDLIKNLEDSSFILLESNYDPEVLKCAPYPYLLKQRIASPLGHLPNETAGKTISYLLKSGLKNAMLGHLSKNSNFPELAYKTVVDELITSGHDETELTLSIASRSEPSKAIEI